MKEKTIDDLGTAHSGWIEPKELKQFLAEKIDERIKELTIDITSRNRQMWSNKLTAYQMNQMKYRNQKDRIRLNELKLIKKELLGDKDR